MYSFNIKVEIELSLVFPLIKTIIIHFTLKFLWKNSVLCSVKYCVVDLSVSTLWWTRCEFAGVCLYTLFRRGNNVQEKHDNTFSFTVWLAWPGAVLLFMAVCKPLLITHNTLQHWDGFQQESSIYMVMCSKLNSWLSIMYQNCCLSSCISILI